MRRAAATVAVLVPLAVFAYLLATPRANVDLNSPVEHLVLTTNVAVLAFFAGVLVARTALQLRQYRALLVALGFGSIGGIFAVHGLSTPGVILRGDSEDALAVVALSAQLSLVVPAVLFAVRYTPLERRLERAVPPRVLVTVVVGAILAYAVVALAAPMTVGAFLRALLPSGMSGLGGYGGNATNNGLGSQDAIVLVPGAIAIALFLFSAVQQGREFLRSKLPLQGALVAAYVLLAQTQIAMTLGQLWSLAWWEYHGLMLAAVAIALGALFVELDRRRGLERFLPPNVVERVIQGDALRLEGERRVVTVMFTDLRGSTALADSLDAESVVAIVNTYLRTMARAVVDRGGIIDKFTGDGLMAIFGAMTEPAAGASAAAGAALDMRAAIGALNTQRAADGAAVLKHGAGLHVGEVVLGAIGLPERSDYTAMGDTVNTAARMESLCKELGVDAVLSGEVAALLDGTARLRALGEATVKGKARSIAVFTLA
ncbi:MAG TPA: adenylate/guanylate cyclase domain-containing protein [Candidatus Limnocylindria bacterium]